MILGQFQFRRDTLANWASVNPILLDGELGIESDTDKFKIGDGVTAWNGLPYGGIKGDTGASGANGQSVAVADEGNTLTNTATSINFVGGGVTATNTGNAVTVTVPPSPTPANAPPPAIASTSSAGTTTGEYALEDHTHAGVTSVNGQQGAVTVSSGTDNTAVTRTAPTASASTALTTIQSFPITGGSIVAGSEFEFYASLRVINTTAASNAVVTVSVGATNVLVLTQAIGTTAAASPGGPVLIRGSILFTSPTQAECVIHFVKSQAVAANIVLNTSAPITVSTGANTTIDLKFNTSAATSTFIARLATIQKVK